MGAENGEYEYAPEIIDIHSPEADRVAFVLKAYESGALSLEQAKELGRELGLNL